MSYRNTESEIKAIIEVSSTVTSLAPFMDMAKLVVDEELVGTGMSDARLKIIEGLLSAHFLAATIDPRSGGGGAGGVSESLLISTGVRLDSTSYGQQAIVLDTSGVLKSMTEGRTSNVVFKHVGVDE
jgi:hypothetical protein